MSKKEVETFRETLVKERMSQLNDLLANAFSVVKTADFYETAQKALNDMRFGLDNQNYFFVIDNDGVFYVYPPNPKLVLTKQIDLTDAEGTKYIQEIIHIAKEKGSGFLEYQELKPGTDRIVTKLSSVKYFKDWKWIICTGIYIDDIEDMVALKQQEIYGAIQNQIVNTITSMGIILVFVMLISFSVSRKISIPIKKASLMLKDIAQGDGDLTKRIKVKSSGEIAELGQWFNVFIKKLNSMLLNISTQSTVLDHASKHVSGISKDISHQIDLSSQTFNAVSSSVAEMSASMSNVALTMKQTAVNVEAIVGSAEEMNTTISDIAKNSEFTRSITSEAVNKMHTASETVEKLDKAAHLIGRVTETIDHISGQINLLALNATIEAGRAGESGRGFAVVANEIKELAKKTAIATKDIRQNIHGIQDTSHVTIETIRNISDVIHRVDQLVGTIAASVEEQSNTSREITQHIAKISDSIIDVTENVTQSSLVANSVDKHIATVAHMTKEMAVNSVTVNQQAQEFARSATELKQIVTMFKLEEQHDPVQQAVSPISKPVKRTKPSINMKDEFMPLTIVDQPATA